MKLFENNFPTAFEELSAYSPDWMRRNREITALWQVVGQQMDELKNCFVQVTDDCFIDTAGEQALTQWEVFLGLQRIGDTLEERRYTIKALLISRHFGEQEILAIVLAYTSFHGTVAFNNSRVTVCIEPGAGDVMRVGACLQMLINRMPAHLLFSFIARSAAAVSFPPFGLAPRTTHRAMLGAPRWDGSIYWDGRFLWGGRSFFSAIRLRCFVQAAPQTAAFIIGRMLIHMPPPETAVSIVSAILSRWDGALAWDGAEHWDGRRGRVELI